MVDLAASVSVEPFAPKENVRIETDPKANKPGDDGFAHPGSDDAVGGRDLFLFFFLLLTGVFVCFSIT